MIRGVEVGSSAVQYCPLDQLTGTGDTTWTLTSADMLSFARQIALAMVNNKNNRRVIKIIIVVHRYDGQAQSNNGHPRKTAL